MELEYPSAWHCVGTTKAYTCTVTTATPYYSALSTSSPIVVQLSTTSPAVGYHDWLFISIVMIFLLSFVPIGFLYSVLRPAKYSK